jgi:hypothetical protein
MPKMPAYRIMTVQAAWSRMMFNILSAIVFEILDWIGFKTNSWWSWIAISIFVVPFLVIAGGALWHGEMLAAFVFASIGLSFIAMKLVSIHRAQDG